MVIAICLCLFALLVYNIVMFRKVNTTYDKISFKESLDLTELPIITFYQDDKKLNFLLDTGATQSLISDSVISTLVYKDTNEVNALHGIEGNKVIVKNVEMELLYKQQKFTTIFQVVPLSNAFGNIKAETGVTLHGILGNEFFQKYKYIIDFNDLVAYSKK